VIQNGSLWIGSGVGEPMESPFSFYGKPIPCAEDTIIVPPKDTVPPPIDTVLPPKDTLKAGRIPSPTSSAGETTLCFEMRLDYGGGCEMAGYAKMNFFAGQITKGNITVADSPSRTYTQILGSYDQKSIHIESVLPGFGVPVADSMMYDGAISNDRTMAKGDYIRLPSEKQGIWTMSSVVCGAWTPKYPDSSCLIKKK
jgi:hypothetical protein